MSTVLKFLFLVFVCIVAVEFQAYAVNSFGAAQSTSAALDSFKGQSADHGTWVTVMMRFWAGNAGLAVMWLVLLGFGLLLFWNEIKSLAYFATEKKE